MTARATLPPPRTSVDPETFILPHDLLAEKSVLGAALIGKSQALYVLDHLKPEAFFRRAHQVIFNTMREVYERDGDVDWLLLKTALDAKGKLDECGGPAYIAALADGIPRSTNVDHYAGILRDLQAKRAIVGYAKRTIDQVAAAEHSAESILADADRRLMDLQGGHVEGRMLSLAETYSQLAADLDWRVAHRGELTGVETGFPQVNEITLGWQPGDLIVLGARPSIGKTTFILNSAVAAAKAGKRVAIFSLEMRRQQLEYRILSHLSGVPLTRILGGYLGSHEYEKITPAIELIHSLPIHIDDRSGVTFWDVRAAVRQLVAEGGVDEVIIDYVQLMPGTLDRRGATRNEEVTDISRKLKTLADEIRAPFLLLSQLSRKARDRYDPRPQLTDLRESGALEQDADIVAFLHRKNHKEGGTTQIIFEKQRQGPTGTYNLTLDRDTVTFTDGGEDPPAPEKSEKKTKTKRSS